MKIVHLSTSDMGGAGVAARRLHLALLEQGLSSRFLTLYKVGGPVKEHYLATEKLRLSFAGKMLDRIKAGLRHRLPFLFRDYQASLKNRPAGYEHFSFPYSTIDLSKNIFIQEADIIHLHWVSDGLLDYGSFFSKIKKPVIWTLHDMNPFTGGCHHSDGSLEFVKDCLNCKQVKGTKDESIAAKNLSYKKRALDLISKRQLAITTPSQWLGDLSQKSMLFRSFEHTVIPNLVGEKIFVPMDKKQLREEFGIDEHKKVLLFVANDVSNPRKGMPELIKAINALEMDNVLICTVGRKMEEGSLNKAVKQFGFISSEQTMAKLYAMADLYVMPSHAENFPNSIIEALLCGVPVLASRVGGIPEQVDAGNGSLFSVGNVAELTAVLTHVLQNLTQYRAEVIRQNSLHKYSVHKVLDQYVTLYKKALNRES